MDQRFLEITRNTSTDVEKTLDLLQLEIPKLETPPRTWRRPLIRNQIRNLQRNTSTDVEKTAYRCT